MLIKLKTTRDQARMIEEKFMPLMIKMAEAKVRNNINHTSKHMTALMLHSQLVYIQKKLKQKLLTDANNMKFSFEMHYAIALYFFLMKMPLEVYHVYAITFRQKLCDTLFQQLFTSEKQSKPVTYHSQY